MNDRHRHRRRVGDHRARGERSDRLEQLVQQCVQLVTTQSVVQENTLRALTSTVERLERTQERVAVLERRLALLESTPVNPLRSS